MAPISLTSILPEKKLGEFFASKMGAMPLSLAIVLARANVYSHANAMLHLNGTVHEFTDYPIRELAIQLECVLI